MSDDDRPDIAEFIHGFLTALPETIRPEITLMVAIYGLDMTTIDLDEMKEEIRKALLEAVGMRKFGAVLRLRAAVDFVLMQRLTVTHRNQANPITFPAHTEMSDAVRRSLDTMQLRGPMMIRHLEDALRKWNVFCGERMSPADLIEYQDRLVRDAARS